MKVYAVVENFTDDCTYSTDDVIELYKSKTLAEDRVLELNIKRIEGGGKEDVFSIKEYFLNTEIVEERCCACNGSGWYDNLDRYGRHIKCGACKGTGKCEV